MVPAIPSISREEFIKKVVIPYFWGNHEKDYMYIIVFDILGRIIYCNQAYASLYKYNSLDEIYGKTYAEIAKDHPVPVEVINKVEIIRNQVLNHQKMIRFIYLANKNTIRGAYINHHFPVFYIDGSVICTAVRIKEHTLMSKSQLFSLGSSKQPMAKDHPETSLTTRQKEVLFLLGTSFSQEEIANHLGITRGTISSCIASICKKLDIQGQNTAALIDIATRMKLISNIPETLVKAGIIMLDNLH